MGEPQIQRRLAGQIILLVAVIVTGDLAIAEVGPQWWWQSIPAADERPRSGMEWRTWTTSMQWAAAALSSTTTGLHGPS